MNLRSITRATLLIAATFTLILPASSFAGDDRYFSSIDKKPDVTVLTVMHPGDYVFRSIMNLQKEGLFPKENILVVGSYHEDEVTDYDKSKAFVKEHNLDWVRFHKIQGRLDDKNLFKKNPATADFERIFKFSDGIIFYGGGDIQPWLYGEKTSLLTKTSTPYRHLMELSFIFHLLGGSQDPSFKGMVEDRPDFPLMAFCLGEQTLNVGTGGTLVQDIFSEKYGVIEQEKAEKLGRDQWHKNPNAILYPTDDAIIRYSFHRIRYEKQGKFVKDLGLDGSATPYVMTAHHQAVDDLGKDMQVSAWSYDGKVVEAIDHKRFPNVFGFQFHPEFPDIWDSNKNIKILPDDELFSHRSILENDPNSTELHSKIWKWFVANLKSQ